MQNLIFAISFVISLNLNAGYIDYYNAVNEGEYHMYEGQYDLAIANFTRAFILVDQPKSRDFFLAAKCYSQIGNEKEMYKYLELAVLGGLDKSFIEADSLWFTNYRFSDGYISTMKLEPSKVEKIKDKDSEEAFHALEKNFKMFKVLKYYKAYHKRDSFPDDYQLKLETYIPYNDSMTNQLVDFYCNYSFPSKNEDIRLLIVMSTMFLSADLPYYNSLKMIFKSNIDKGIVTPSHYMNLFENFQLQKLNPYQRVDKTFGTAENSIAKEDFEQILKNRKEIGMSTYYVSAPNYFKNYKPVPIEKLIRL
ncbi:MAG: hypothetical protein AB8B72_07065 [Crocinitomicaceae bacterium]